MLQAFLLTTLISEHPGAIAALLGLLLSSLSGLAALYWKLIASRLDKLEHTDQRLADRVGRVEEAIIKYEEHIGAGDNMLNRLEASITSLGLDLKTVHQDNLAAHAAIVERLAKVEGKLPNGELGEMLLILRRLDGR